MDMPFAQAKQYLSKITASHFSTLSMKFANQNVLKSDTIPTKNGQELVEKWVSELMTNF